MRIAAVFAILLPVALLAAEPKVEASISAEDVRGICRAVVADGHDPVGEILSVPADARISRLRQRSDLVWAITSPKTGLPVQYTLEKSAHRWSIVKKKQMVD